MRLGRGCEVVRDADVQLVRTEPKPHATPCGEQRRLLELLEPEEVAVEAPGVVLAPGRGCDLDVVETDDVVAHRIEKVLDASRDPGPEKRTRFSRWVPCRTPATPSSEPELPSCECWFTLRARGHA